MFREFPYLYDGNLAYEKKYLSRYINCERSLVILALSDNQVIGTSTCIPLIDESIEFKSPFKNSEYEIANTLYLGESVILPTYRGQKIGHNFFKIREEHGKEVLDQFKYSTFCAVKRPIDHPLKPKNYKNLHEFWKRMGYQRDNNLVTTLKWKDIDKYSENSKKLTYWVKRWTTF